MGTDFEALCQTELRQLPWIIGVVTVSAILAALSTAVAFGGRSSIILAAGAALLAFLLLHLGLWLIRLARVGKLPGNTPAPVSPRTHFVSAVLIAVHLGLTVAGLMVLVLLIVGFVAGFGVSVSGPALAYIAIVMMIVRAIDGALLNLGILLNSAALKESSSDI